MVAAAPIKPPRSLLIVTDVRERNGIPSYGRVFSSKDFIAAARAGALVLENHPIADFVLIRPDALGQVQEAFTEMAGGVRALLEAGAKMFVPREAESAMREAIGDGQSQRRLLGYRNEEKIERQLARATELKERRRVVVFEPRLRERSLSLA